jgi:hypothetical protein
VLRTLAIILTASVFHIAASGDEPEKTISEGRLLVGDETKHLILAPDGKKLGELAGLPGTSRLVGQAISPDGKRVALIMQESPPKDRADELLRYVIIRDIDGKGTESKVEVKAQNMAWTVNGKLLVVEIESLKDLKARKFTTWLVNVDANAKTRLDLPESAQALALTPDGKNCLASTNDASKGKIHLSLISLENKKITHLTEINEESSSSRLPKLSPDGLQILLVDEDGEEEIGKDTYLVITRLFVFNLKTQKRERVEGQDRKTTIHSYAWSPDSKRLVYSWERRELDLSLLKDGKIKLDVDVGKETEWHVTVADANGKNARNVHSAKVPNEIITEIKYKKKKSDTLDTIPVRGSVIFSYHVDWR